MSTLPTYFLSHGGGPWPFMMDQVGHLYGRLDASLRDIPRQVGVTPKAVLVITAHWEAAISCCRPRPSRR
jgi:aromatic ring-opening dioxygenase catalytic subunit (LigB family)